MRSMRSMVLLVVVLAAIACKKKEKNSTMDLVGQLFQLACVMPPYTPSIKTENSIAVLEEIKINGVMQSILVRGENVNNPVLLVLHGGPGDSIVGSARTLFSALESKYVVVAWDQRGGGKSEDLGVELSQLKISTFVNDVISMSEYLRNRFSRNRIFLLGHSWGTLIGVLAVKQHPEYYSAFVGTGQMVNMLRGDKLGLDYALKHARDKSNSKAISELESIGEPPYTLDELLVQRKWVSEYGGNTHGSMISTKPGGEMNLCEYLATSNNGLNLAKAMIDEIYGIDLLSRVTRLDVPLFFLQGRYDMVSPSVLAEEFHKGLAAPQGKTFHYLENSAHMTLYEENQLFNDYMIKTVLPAGL